MEKRYTKDDYKFYFSNRNLFIELPYEGRVYLGNGSRGGEDFVYVDYIEFDESEKITQDVIDEIEDYTEKNLVEILKTAEKI